MRPSIWSISVSDFFTKKMLAFAFGPFIATLIAFAIFLSPVYHALVDTNHSSKIQYETKQTSYEGGSALTEESNIIYTGDSAFLDFMLNNSVVSWIFLTFSFFLLMMVMFILAMVVAIFIIGFLTPSIMKELQKRHYHDVALEGHGNVVTGIFHSIKYVMIMFVLLIVLIPFYFIPFVNIIAVNLPFYYLFHKFYMLDVTTTAMTKEQTKKMFFFKGNQLRMHTLMLYFLSMVPFAALITPVFNVIVLSHVVLRAKQEVLEAPESN